jgi:uncharacterized protein YegL
MDVVFVIDRSGSMMDGLLDTVSRKNQSTRRTKMELTIEATKEIFEVFKENEEIGIISFNNGVEVIEELKPKGSINKNELFNHLDTISAQGGTNMEIGMRKAIEMLLNSPNRQRKKKIVFLSNGCPSAGMDEQGLKGMA